MPEPPSEAISIGVVVVAYRSTATIEACVRSCLADPQVTALVVVDNSADEPTRQAVLQLGDPRVLYRLSPNRGFAVGCNRGVAALPGDVTWVAFVNPDVELDRALSDLVSRPEVATACIVGAHVESPRSPGVPSARPGVTRRRELGKAAVGTRAYALKPSGDKPVHVEQVSGALLLVRRPDLEKLGGFDERFELYYEDVDLCARAAALGGCLFVPTRWGRHVGGASAAAVGEQAYIAGRVSRMRYLRKHRPGIATETSLALMAGVEAVTRSVARGPEGRRGRVEGLRAQWREARTPGSVRSLR